MPRGDWRIVLAVVIGLGGVLSTYGYYKVDEATQSEKPSGHYQPAKYASLPHRRVAGEPQTQIYDPHCQEPQNQADSDLCAQWSAVKAVDESNRLVRIGILLSFVLGAIGILATAIGTVLIYRSLRQSDENLVAARNALAQGYRSERAYVAFRVPEDKAIGFNGISQVLKINALNIGRTPARVFAAYGTRLDQLPEASAYMAGVKFREEFYVIGADGSFPFETPLAGATNDEQFFVSAVRYRDCFGNRHEAWGCLSFKPLKREIRTVGGALWNKDEQMEPEK